MASADSGTTLGHSRTWVCRRVARGSGLTSFLGVCCLPDRSDSDVHPDVIDSLSPVSPPAMSDDQSLDLAAMLAIASWCNPRESQLLEQRGKLAVAACITAAHDPRGRWWRRRETLGMRMSIEKLRRTRVPYVAARVSALRSNSSRCPRSGPRGRRTRARAPARRSADPDLPRPPLGRFQPIRAAA